MTEFTKEELNLMFNLLIHTNKGGIMTEYNNVLIKLQSMIASYSPTRTEKEILRWIVTKEDEIKKAMEMLDETAYKPPNIYYLSGREEILKELFAFLTEAKGEE